MQLGKEAQQEVQDFYIFPDNEVAWFDQFATVTPSGSQGSLFLWDSRTAHAVSGSAADQRGPAQLSALSSIIKQAPDV